MYLSRLLFIILFVFVILIRGQSIDKRCDRLCQIGDMLLRVLAVFKLVIVIIDSAKVGSSDAETEEIFPPSSSAKGISHSGMTPSSSLKSPSVFSIDRPFPRRTGINQSTMYSSPFCPCKQAFSGNRHYTSDSVPAPPHGFLHEISAQCGLNLLSPSHRCIKSDCCKSFVPPFQKIIGESLHYFCADIVKGNFQLFICS